MKFIIEPAIKKETASYIKTRGIWKLEPKTTCLKLIYEEIESLNGSITIKETESVLEFKILLAKKKLVLEDLIGRFYQAFKEHINPTLGKLFQNRSSRNYLQIGS